MYSTIVLSSRPLFSMPLFFSGCILQIIQNENSGKVLRTPAIHITFILAFKMPFVFWWKFCCTCKFRNIRNCKLLNFNQRIYFFFQKHVLSLLQVTIFFGDISLQNLKSCGYTGLTTCIYNFVFLIMNFWRGQIVICWPSQSILTDDDSSECQYYLPGQYITYSLSGRPKSIFYIIM